MVVMKNLRTICCPNCSHVFPIVKRKEYQRNCATCSVQFTAHSLNEKFCSDRCWERFPPRVAKGIAKRKAWYARKRTDKAFMKSASRKASKYTIERAKRDPVFRIKMNLRSRARKMMMSDQVSISRAIGCNSSTLRQHIESRFTGTMTWDNYGSVWVIDHILPLSAFDLSNPEHVREVNHYTNLQPLTKEANSLKSDRLF